MTPPPDGPPEPPPQAVPPPAPDGLPHRTVPWGGGPANVHALPGRAQDGSKLFVLIIDSSTSRSVSYWTPAELKALSERLFREATGGITIADASDLAKLKDAGQIIVPPG